jgi:hypothetical protein
VSSAASWVHRMTWCDIQSLTDDSDEAISLSSKSGKEQFAMQAMGSVPHVSGLEGVHGGSGSDGPSCHLQDYQEQVTERNDSMARAVERFLLGARMTHFWLCNGGLCSRRRGSDGLSCHLQDYQEQVTERNDSMARAVERFPSCSERVRLR